MKKIDHIITCDNWGNTWIVWPLACITLGKICTGKGMVCSTVCPPVVDIGIWTGIVAWGTPGIPNWTTWFAILLAAATLPCAVATTAAAPLGRLLPTAKSSTCK